MEGEKKIFMMKSSMVPLDSNHYPSTPMIRLARSRKEKELSVNSLAASMTFQRGNNHSSFVNDPLTHRQTAQTFRETKVGTSLEKFHKYNSQFEDKEKEPSLPKIGRGNQDKKKTAKSFKIKNIASGGTKQHLANVRALMVHSSLTNAHPGTALAKDFNNNSVKIDEPSTIKQQTFTSEMKDSIGKFNLLIKDTVKVKVPGLINLQKVIKKVKKNQQQANPEKMLAPPYMVYYYSMVGGNNSEMVERILANRTWWKKFPVNTGKPSAQIQGAQVQFYWKMLCDNFDFSRISDGCGSYLTKKSINRFTHADELGDKDNFFRNMWFMAKRTSQNIFDNVPLTFSFRMHEVQFEKDMQDFCRIFIANERKCSVDSVNPVKTIFDEKLKENINIYYDFGDLKFPNRSHATRKFKQIEAHSIVKIPEFFHEKNMWIIKPSGCDRGKGVEIFKSLDELQQFMKLYSSGYNMSEYMNMNYSDNDDGSPALKDGGMAKRAYKTIFPKFVIQKYMEKPALFKGHKFDIRAHALMTQDGSVYVFRDSYVRICSLRYDLNKQNYFGHLCNTSVNMKSGSFGQIAVGNTISIVELAEFFDSIEGNNPKNSIGSFEPYFFEEIKRLVKFAFDGTNLFSNLINPSKVPNTFELFGFDVMVDASYRCWLIEANFIPGLTDESNDYLKAYLDRMTDDMFKLTLDEMYPLPRNAKRTVEEYPFMNFPNDQNLWVFVCKYDIEKPKEREPITAIPGHR
jgi:hypothetical protein